MTWLDLIGLLIIAVLITGGCTSTRPIDCRTFDRDNGQAWATCVAGHKPGRHAPAELLFTDWRT